MCSSKEATCGQLKCGSGREGSRAVGVVKTVDFRQRWGQSKTTVVKNNEQYIIR